MIKKEDVNKAVVDFCMDVIKEPLIYFNESDLHLLLAEKLYEEFPSLKIPKHETNLSPSDDAERKYRTRLLHREYGGGKKTRIDVTIFDIKDVKDIKNAHLTKEKKEDYLLPLFAFELGISIDGTETHIKNDINKLKRCKTTGYILHIVRDTNKFKRKDKMLKIEGFKKIIDKNYKENRDNDKIKIIAVVLHLFRKQGETRCEIFDGSIRDWRPFENPRTSESKIKELLKSQLE